MNVTIIGSGNMAKGIATRFVSGGHSVAVHAKDTEKAKELQNAVGDVTLEEIGAPVADVVVLATPYTEVEAIAANYGGFKGKVVVDISNPVDFNTFQLLTPRGESGAEHVAEVLPEAKVVKAFNINLAGVLAAGEVEGKQPDVFMAGDDEAAKASVKELINTSGMRALDVGPLAEARHLEGFGLIQMKLQDQLSGNWMSMLKFLG